MIKAFEIVKQNLPSARLVIAGDGHDRKQLESYVRKHKIEDVEFRGYISDKEKQTLLKKSGLFCSPAIYGESFGIVLLEAMSAGVPLVAGDNPGYTSVLKDLGILSLVDPVNTNLFAQRLQLFLTNRDLRKMMSAWGLKYVKQFDYKLIVSKYEEVYKHAIERQKT